jgi:hypothetical protein
MFAVPTRLDVNFHQDQCITVDLTIACDSEGAMALWAWFRNFNPDFRGPNERDTAVPKERQLGGPMANLLGGPSDNHKALDYDRGLRSLSHGDGTDQSFGPDTGGTGQTPD